MCISCEACRLLCRAALHRLQPASAPARPGLHPAFADGTLAFLLSPSKRLTHAPTHAPWPCCTPASLSTPHSGPSLPSSTPDGHPSSLARQPPLPSSSVCRPSARILSSATVQLHSFSFRTLRVQRQRVCGAARSPGCWMGRHRASPVSSTLVSACLDSQTCRCPFSTTWGSSATASR